MTQDMDDFHARQRAAQARINALDKGQLVENPDRADFFDEVYASANGDAANVPWADLQPKPKLSEWLASHGPAQKGERAMDVACGLGDHAEALAQAGYETTAFDNAAEAVRWARERFPNSPVDYQKADLFDLPKAWLGAFDLVYECFTMQAMPPETLSRSQPAIASLVAPGKTLLVYTRLRPDGASVEGPPWPLEESAVYWFAENGFELVREERFETVRPDKTIPLIFCEWRRV